MEKYMYGIGQEIELTNGKIVQVLDIDKVTGQIICSVVENGQSITRAVNLSEVKNNFNTGDYLKG
jgi:predicted hydrolase (HD superfamily)